VSAVVAGADPETVSRALGLEAPPASPLSAFAASSRAWLKIQDGCDEHCTFCATTLARGANRSRTPQAIAAEARLLAERHAELVLTGVHIGTWGRDLGGERTLGGLARLLVDEVPGVRFRLSSIEATEVDDDLARLLLERPDRLAPHLHAPLQSGSDRLLKKMGRHWYTASAYRSRIEVLAKRVAPLGLGADVIVGFPGESDEDHRATVALIEALPFTYLHVFPYSPRSGTAAPRLGEPAPASTQRERSAELRELAARKAAAHRKARAGGRADLVLESRQGGVAHALSEDYLGVEVPAGEPWVLGRRRVAARLALAAGGRRLVAEAA
jgi:threonylcarbamoyladenosine tRNA methylthiotransferase MtaB